MASAAGSSRPLTELRTVSGRRSKPASSGSGAIPRSSSVSLLTLRARRPGATTPTRSLEPGARRCRLRRLSHAASITTVTGSPATAQHLTPAARRLPRPLPGPGWLARQSSCLGCSSAAGLRLRPLCTHRPDLGDKLPRREWKVATWRPKALGLPLPEGCVLPAVRRGRPAFAATHRASTSTSHGSARAAHYAPTVTPVQPVRYVQPTSPTTTPAPSASGASSSGGSSSRAPAQSSPPNYSPPEHSTPAPQPARASPSGALTCISNCG